MDEKQFTDDELSLIFDPKNYLDETINRKSHIRFLVFWISLLGLWTSCRLNEICQLYVTDVKPIGKLWCLDINNKTPDKSLNNPTSRRIIPIPQTLIDLGFIKYVQTLEKRELRESFQNSHLVKMDIQGTSVDSSMRNIFQN